MPNSASALFTIKFNVKRIDIDKVLLDLEGVKCINARFDPILFV